MNRFRGGIRRLELLTGALFLLGVVHFGPTRVALKFCIFAAIQVALIVTDFEERILRMSLRSWNDCRIGAGGPSSRWRPG